MQGTSLIEVLVSLTIVGLVLLGGLQLGLRSAELTKQALQDTQTLLQHG